MTDANQQSFSAGAAAESMVAHSPKKLRQRIPAPIWRFRPALQPVSVVGETGLNVAAGIGAIHLTYAR